MSPTATAARSSCGDLLVTDGDAALDAPFDGEPPPFFSAIVAGDRCDSEARCGADASR